MKKYYFMAGLPRSGSTLLSSILNQNPRIHSGPSSPVTTIMLGLETILNQDELYNAYPKPQQAVSIIGNVIHQFYSDVDKPVIIDKNRSWVNRPGFIKGYMGIEPKIICPVRNIDEILTSFLIMQRKYPIGSSGKINFIDDMLVKSNLPLTDEVRCEFLASGNGILGQSYSAIKDLLMAGNQSMLHFVEYDDLINDTEATMRKLYDFIGEDYYNHSFDSITNIHKERDAEVYGIPDMHDVRPTINKVSYNPEDILPKSILDKCKGTEFWRDLEPIEVQESDTRIIG